MKIAIINDTHFGARNDSPLFLEYFMSFFEKQFFPYCKEHGITKVLHLGDLMDRRKYVNFNTLAEVRKRFVECTQCRVWFTDAIRWQNNVCFLETPQCRVEPRQLRVVHQVLQIVVALKTTCSENNLKINLGIK